MIRIDISTHKYPDSFALIDDDDFGLINQRKWRINKNHCGILYAVCSGLRMHRVIMGLTKKDGLIVDHINRNSLDNQKHNLRICTNQQNSLNSKSRRGSSQYKGVTRYKNNNWQAQITVNGRHIRLGSHVLEIDAARAYDEKAKELYKEHAYLNFPEEK